MTWVLEDKPTTVTAAGDFVRRIDEIQYALDEGPCLEAYATQRLVLTDDLTREQRWPRFTSAALTHGLRGLVAVPLRVRSYRLGALNVYALQAHVLDEIAAETAGLFAEQASIVLANAEAFTRAQATAVSLGQALTSRSVIDMAKGILMARDECGPAEAFDLFRQASQTQHRKLREVAQELVDGVTNQPEGDTAVGGRPIRSGLLSPRGSAVGVAGIVAAHDIDPPTADQEARGCQGAVQLSGSQRQASKDEPGAPRCRGFRLFPSLAHARTLELRMSRG